MHVLFPDISFLLPVFFSLFTFSFCLCLKLSLRKAILIIQTFWQICLKELTSKKKKIPLISCLGNEQLVNQWMAPTSTKGTPKMSNPQTSGSIMRDWSWNPSISPQTQTPSWLILRFLVTLKISHLLTIRWTATSIKGGILTEVRIFSKCLNHFPFYQVVLKLVIPIQG